MIWNLGVLLPAITSSLLRLFYGVRLTSHLTFWWWLVIECGGVAALLAGSN